MTIINGFTALLPRTAGPAVAKEIIMLGEPFTAAQARTWGLVNRVAADNDLDNEVDRVISALRDKSPTALRLAKHLLDQSWDGSLEEVMSRETEASVEAALSADAREAATAFTEGRQPRFRS
jgi:enoyl-CoA hydratase/carnithine racemase